MLDTVVLVLSLAMIVLFAAALWYFVKSLIVMGKKSVLLAVLGFLFSPLAQIIYYLVEKQNLSLDDKKTLVRFFWSIIGMALIGIIAGIPHCQNSCHPHPNNPNGGKGDNHGTIQCRAQTSHTKQTFIT